VPTAGGAYAINLFTAATYLRNSGPGVAACRLAAVAAVCTALVMAAAVRRK
jgi:hypothetical protein